MEVYYKTYILDKRKKKYSIVQEMANMSSCFTPLLCLDLIGVNLPTLFLTRVKQ